MARVTVEDCLRNVKNRFELVIVASKRARQLMRGKEPKVPWDNDKPTVVALREIAAGFTNINNINALDAHEEAQITIVQEEVVIIETPPVESIDRPSSSTEEN